MNTKDMLGPMLPEKSMDQDGGGWDIKELLERLEGDQELLRELLEMYREDCPVSLSAAIDALSSGDLETLQRAAHTLKGMLKNLAMNVPAEIAAAVENAALDKNIQEAKTQMPLLVKSLQELLPKVEAQLAEAQV